MGKKQDYMAIRVWKKEIKRRSNPWSNILKAIIAAIAVIFLVAVAILNVVFPKDGSSLIFQGIKIDSAIKDVLSAIAAVVALLFSLKLFPPVRDWYCRPRLRYMWAALEIISQLREEGLIDDSDKTRLVSIASSRLDVTRDITFQGDAEELLCEACSEMARMIRERLAGASK